MEIQTTKEVMKRYATTEGNSSSYIKKFNDQRWINLEELLKEIDDMIESVETAGCENPIDEAYYNALLNVKNAITSNKN